MSNTEQPENVVELPQKQELTGESFDEKFDAEVQAKGDPSKSTFGGEVNDVVASVFGMFWPQWKQAFVHLSSKQKTRLILSLMEYPLQEKPLVFPTKLEKDMFNLGERLLSAKYMMIIQTYSEQMGKMLTPEQAIAETTAAATEPTTETDKNEGEKV